MTDEGTRTRRDEETVAEWPYTVHDLKTVQPWFDAVKTGVKTFEIRRNDRQFWPGDLLLLREWWPEQGMYGGQPPVLREVTYVLRGGTEFGVAEGVCVLGIRPVASEARRG